MRASISGWRTAESRRRAAPTAAVPSPAFDAVGSSGITYDIVDPTADLAAGMPWQRVRWSVALIGLLGYIWATTTYSLPIGQTSIIVALVGLVFLGQPLRFPAFLLLFAAFLAWAVVGSLGSLYPAAVADRLEVLWKVGLIALVVVTVVNDRTTQRVFMFFYLGAYALYPVRGTILNYLGGYTTFGRALWNYAYANPNDLAAMTLLQLGLALALLAREPKGWPRWAALAGVVLLPIVILLTQSRGAILALAAAALLIIVRQRKRARAIVGVAVVALAGAVAAPDSLWMRLEGLRGVTDTGNLVSVDTEGSAEQRFEIWRVARAIVADHPVSGVGAGAYQEAHAVYASRGDFKPTARGKRDTHSTYLNVLAETGFVGLGLFLALIATVLVQTERARRHSRERLPRSSHQLLYLQLGLVAYLLAGVFGSYAGLAILYIYLAFMWSAARTVRDELALVR